MPQVARAEVRERAARLRAKGDTVLSGFLAAQHGRAVDVLMERVSLGRTRHFAELSLEEGAQVGQIVRARVTGHDGRRLTGKVMT
jgi:threonylcarbamoyladenosine tRNA methylthiotransferase MtaB